MKDIRIAPKRSATEKDTSLVVFLLVVMLFLMYLFRENRDPFEYQVDIQEANVFSASQSNR